MSKRKPSVPTKPINSKTLKVSPVARAVRSALAISATLLALGAPGMAQAAGNCVFTAPTTVNCDGNFTGILPGSYFTPVSDLTLILGENQPTSVTPGNGIVGIDATWSGNIGIISNADITTTGADGILADSSASASVSNYGDISTKVTNPSIQAVNITAYGDVYLQNGGTIFAYGAHTPNVTAVTANSTHGNVSIDNLASGTISAEAHYAGDFSNVTGVRATAYDSAYITNDGNIYALSANGPQLFSDTIGAFAESAHGTASITNTTGGVITAISGGTANGILTDATGNAQSNYIDNAGSVNVTTIGVRAAAFGLHGGVSHVLQLKYAPGLYHQNPVNATVTNTGSVSVVTGGFDALGYGMYAYSRYGDTIQNNFGTISVQEQIDSSGPAYTLGGICSYDKYGGIVENNYGAISVTTLRRGEGIKAVSGHIGARYGDDGASITNAGDISVNSGLIAYGIMSTVAYNGNNIINNSGDIGVNTSGYAGRAPLSIGIRSTANAGYMDVTNAGTITSTAAVTYHGQALGIFARNTGVGNSAISNAGTIEADGYYAFGILSSIWAEEGFGNLAYITNSGTVTANGNALGYAVWASFPGTSVSIENSGSIYAVSDPLASPSFDVSSVGVKADVSVGDFGLYNSGLISASTQSNQYMAGVQAVATGVSVLNNFGTSTDVSNSASGVIEASAATAHYSSASAAGISIYSDATSTVGVTNAGAVRADAYSGATSGVGLYGGTTAAGIEISDFFGASSTVGNASSGAIDASAVAAHYGNAEASGVNVYDGYGSVGVTNAGSIVVAATADTPSSGGMASAFGVVANGSYGGTAIVDNSSTGTIAATATGDLGAYAMGVMANGASASVYSDGNIEAAATADATQGTALATGMLVTGNYSTVELGGSSHLAATASGYGGNAIGLAISSNYAVTASNAGSVDAMFTGTHGAAYGVLIASGGSVNFTNSGDITVSTQSGYATGVELSSPSYATLVNTGVINTSIASAGSLAVLMGDSSNQIQNTGTINGSIVSGNGNDSLSNGVGGIWNTGMASSFGGGNDTISNAGTINGAMQFGNGNDVFANAATGLWNLGGSANFGGGNNSVTNAGTINLNAATIDLGSSNANSFDNTGLVTLVGSNAIDLGGGTFTNDGSLTFASGTTADGLTITGNFAGTGQINVDASTQQNSSDMVHILGNVVAGTANTINVHLLDDPLTASSTIPVVTISGASQPGDFVLGSVTQSKSFLALSYQDRLLSNASGGGVANETYSLGVTVSGLSDLGSLAASIAPGVQSLMIDQIGTLQERMGALEPDREGKLGVWARVFNASGEVSPQHTAGNFGQNGTFAFHQDNSGGEVGLDVAITNQVRAGVMFDKAQADQRLEVSAGGTSRITGHTSGIYATWLAPNGFYLDASYRWMRFGTTLTAPAGTAWASGDADAFNLESGKAWIAHDGLSITPQIQYTSIQVNHINSMAGAMAGFQSSGDSSSRGRLGVMISRTFTATGQSHVLWTPYASISAVHEFNGVSHYAIDSDFFGQTSTRGTSTLIEAGLDMRSGRFAMYGGVNWQDGGALKSVLGGQIGLRYQW